MKDRRVNINRLFCYVAFFAFALGSPSAVPLKVLCINQAYDGFHVRAANTLTQILRELSVQNGFTLTVPDSVAATRAMMNADSLEKYQVVVFNNNDRIGYVITDAGQRLAFQRWLKHGGGLVGWHGLMDHADLWPFLTDSVFSGTKFIEHSQWASAAGHNAQVQVDTVLTNGMTQARKSEYNDLLAVYPKTHWTWPDEWMSLRANPRNVIGRAADILLTIDENTYDVPGGGAMGPDHPIAWAYTLPPDSTGQRGRFIYNARGHDTAAFVGKGTNAAPNGIDTGAAGLTRTWAWQSIRWAAGLTQSSVAVRAVSNGSHNGSLNARNQNGALQVSVYGMKKYVVEVYDLAGHRLIRQAGEGGKEHSFSNLERAGVYLIRVHSSGQTYSSRVVFQ